MHLWELWIIKRVHDFSCKLKTKKGSWNSWQNLNFIKLHKVLNLGNLLATKCYSALEYLHNGQDQPLHVSSSLLIEFEGCTVSYGLLFSYCNPWIDVKKKKQGTVLTVWTEKTRYCKHSCMNISHTFLVRFRAWNWRCGLSMRPSSLLGVNEYKVWDCYSLTLQYFFKSTYYSFSWEITFQLLIRNPHSHAKLRAMLSAAGKIGRDLCTT